MRRGTHFGEVPHKTTMTQLRKIHTIGCTALQIITKGWEVRWQWGCQLKDYLWTQRYLHEWHMRIVIMIRYRWEDVRWWADDVVAIAVSGNRISAAKNIAMMTCDMRVGLVEMMREPTFSDSRLQASTCKRSKALVNPSHTLRVIIHEEN